ncbi:MAG: PA2169 family four-helix-bundle protein [Microbacterium sp.]|nr:MAG: PA2169 family four-helix-bundle protein [Microbacterium sp.]
MSDDKKVGEELVETLKDGEHGFASAAEKVRDSDHAEWADTLQRLSEQRAGFRNEIVALGHEYADDVDVSGSAAAALHRGWISLKDALTGDDAGGVLGAAVTGENHAVTEYEKALEQDLSPGFREVVARQHAAVVAARDEVKALHDAA